MEIIIEETSQTYPQSLTAMDDTGHSLWKVTKRLKQPLRPIPPVTEADKPGYKVINKKLTLLQELIN
jgi:hypothetical protein